MALAKLPAQNANAEPVASLKRKRPSPAPETAEKDPKLNEFLQAMQAPSKLRGNRGEEVNMAAQQEDTKVVVPEADSDSEYENVPKKQKSAAPAVKVPVPAAKDAMDVDSPAVPQADQAEESAGTTEPRDTAMTDDDWMRSRTSRLLGLAADDEEEDASATHVPSHTVPAEPSPEPADIQPDSEAKDEPFEGFEDEPTSVDEVEEKVRASQRLYLRNLSYATREDDLRSAFAGFGNLEEVSCGFFFFLLFHKALVQG